MTEEIKTYTDSALSDIFKEFFKSFKDNDGNYKYVDTIDDCIFNASEIEIDYDDFIEVIKTIITTHPLNQIHRVVYRAIVEVHQTKVGSMVETAKDENRIKFKILNNEIFENKVFDISFDLTEDEQTFETYQKSIPDFRDPYSPAKWLTNYYIFKQNIISKLTLFEKINSWSLKLETILTEKKINGIIDEVFESPKVVEHTSKIAFDMGRNGDELLVDSSQINEVAWFMKGKFRIKRVELDGRLCYYNGEFYDNKTQEIIQREIRAGARTLGLRGSDAFDLLSCPMNEDDYMRRIGILTADDRDTRVGPDRRRRGAKNKKKRPGN